MADQTVVDEVGREVERLSGNVTKLHDTVNRELETLRGLTSKDSIQGIADVVVREQAEKLTKLIATAQTELEGKLKKEQDRNDELERRLNRGFLGGAEASAEMAKAALDFHKTRLAVRKQLNVMKPVKAEDVDVAEYQSWSEAFPQYLRRDERALDQQAMTVGSDPDGGYLVPTAVSTRILKKIWDVSPIRQIANVETVGTDALEFPIDDGEAGAGWVGEVEPRPVTATPQIGVARIVVHEMYANPAVSQKLLEDAAVDVEAWLANKVSERFARLEGVAFVSGNGVNKPRGFLTYADGTARGQIEQIASGSATDVTADALVKLVFALKEPFAPNARWVMRRASVAGFMLLKDTTGQYIWRPGLEQAAPATLLGYPVTECADMPAVGAGALPVAFGDWKQAYTIVDRLGIVTLRDPYTMKPFVLFYTRKRVGGDVVVGDAIKLLRISAS